MVRWESLIVATLAVSAIALASAPASLTILVSKNSDGGSGDSWSMFPAVDYNGTRIVFESRAADLTKQGTSPTCGSQTDVHCVKVFVADLRGDTISPVPLGRVPNADSGTTAISGDGSTVAFWSFADNLVANDLNGRKDLFWYRIDTGELRLVTAGGSVDIPGCRASCGFPSLNEDGSLMAFDAWFDGLVPNDANGGSDVFLYRAGTDTIEIISIGKANATAEGSSWLGHHQALSADGRFVVFQSRALALEQAETTTCREGAGSRCLQIYRVDLMANEIRQVSISSAGHSGNGDSGFPSIDASGRHVAFASKARNVGPATDLEGFRILIWDAENGLFASPPPPLNTGTGESILPSLSRGAANVVFVSSAQWLPEHPGHGQHAAYAWDPSTGEVTPVFLTKQGALPGGNFGRLAVASDGSVVVGFVDSDDLLSEDTNGAYDVFASRLVPAAHQARPTASQQSAPGGGPFFPLACLVGFFALIGSRHRTH